MRPAVRPHKRRAGKVGTTCAAVLERRRDVSCAEVVADEEQRGAMYPGQRVGEAIAKIQPGARAKKAMSGTQCRPFSIDPCASTALAKASGVRWAEETEKRRLAVVSRSRVTSASTMAMVWPPGRRYASLSRRSENSQSRLAFKPNSRRRIRNIRKTRRHPSHQRLSTRAVDRKIPFAAKRHFIFSNAVALGRSLQPGEMLKHIIIDRHKPRGFRPNQRRPH